MCIEKSAAQQSVTEGDISIIMDYDIATRDDQDAKMKEKILTYPVKYHVIPKSFNGRDEERIMRNEWD